MAFAGLCRPSAVTPNGLRTLFTATKQSKQRHNIFDDQRRIILKHYRNYRKVQQQSIRIKHKYRKSTNIDALNGNRRYANNRNGENDMACTYVQKPLKRKSDSKSHQSSQVMNPGSHTKLMPCNYDSHKSEIIHEPSKVVESPHNSDKNKDLINALRLCLRYIVRSKVFIDLVKHRLKLNGITKIRATIHEFESELKCMSGDHLMHNFSALTKMESDTEMAQFILPHFLQGKGARDLLAEKERRVNVSDFFQFNKKGHILRDPVLDAVSDLSEPHEWFPLARNMPRKIVLHVGPTNSGKSWNALQALSNARSGCYAGPLRLLAWEVQEKLQSAGIKCNLLTGQEIVQIDGAHHVSSTIELLALGHPIDVAVIDEFQMIGSADRGAAWTRAFLGVPADEVHICGDESIIALAEQLCIVTGEPFEIHRYERLVPLMASKPVINLGRLRKGDAIIVFSRREIHAIKAQIERETSLRCATIYGSLPPDVRKSQAEQFNTGLYDVLVASDAVGMGLNLAIGRIIFYTLCKFDGASERLLTPSEARQIAGRAGRFGSSYSVGYVTTFNSADARTLKMLLSTPLHSLTKAGLEPPFELIAQLSKHKPQEKYSNLLRYFTAHSALDELYFVSLSESIFMIADLIEDLDMSLQERYWWTLSPVSNKLNSLEALKCAAVAYVQHGQVLLSDIPYVHFPELPSLKHIDLLTIEQAETAWQTFDLYIWLTKRFGELKFPEAAQAVIQRNHLGAWLSRALSAKLKRSRLDRINSWSASYV